MYNGEVRKKTSKKKNCIKLIRSDCSSVLRVAADKHAEDNSFLCSRVTLTLSLSLSLIWCFLHSVIPRLPSKHTFYLLCFLLPVRAPGLPTLVFLCALQVCLWSEQTMTAMVNSSLLAWMAALICSVQVARWQWHMCWWQLRAEQTAPPYNALHCTPVLLA